MLIDSVDTLHKQKDHLRQHHCYLAVTNPMFVRRLVVHDWLLDQWTVCVTKLSWPSAIFCPVNQTWNCGLTIFWHLITPRQYWPAPSYHQTQLSRHFSPQFFWRRKSKILMVSIKPDEPLLLTSMCVLYVIDGCFILCMLVINSIAS